MNAAAKCREQWRVAARTHRAKGRATLVAKDEVIDRQMREIMRLRKVLEFYADPFGKHDQDGEPIRVPDFYNETDFGARAQDALADPIARSFELHSQAEGVKS